MHPFADRAVNDGVRFFFVGEQKRKVKDRQFFGHTCQNAGVHHGHFERATLNGRHVRLIATEHARQEQVHLHLAAGFGGDDVGEFLHARDRWMTLRAIERELDGLFLRRHRAHATQRSHCNRSDQSFKHHSFHWFHQFLLQESLVSTRKFSNPDAAYQTHQVY